MSESTLYTTKDGIASLVINRPEERNSLNTEVLRGLMEGLEKAAQDPEVKVIILTGAGEKAFCAGGDLKSFQGGAFLDQHRGRGLLADLFQKMQSSAKPIIGRINGHALGGGFGLMLACDLVIASESAQLGTPEIQVGLFPMMVLTQVVRHLGPKRALELVLTGDKITAKRAEELGLINRSVPAENLDKEVNTLAEKLKALSPAVLGLGKDAYYRVLEMEFGAALDYLHSQLSINILTEDAAEGIMAFIEKRKPEWKGK